MVSPWSDHGYCFLDCDKTNTPSAILSEKLSTGEYKGTPTEDPITKYSTLKQLNMTSYFAVFWVLHDYLAQSFCKSLKQLNSIANGIEIKIFSNILLSNIQQIYNGNIENAPWNKICMICERFSSINAANQNVIVLEL